MITGLHAIVLSPEAQKVRAFFADVLGLPSADAGGGWLIFAMPQGLGAAGRDPDARRRGTAYLPAPAPVTAAAFN